MKDFLKLLRVKHWVKNVLVVVPLFFSQNLLQRELWISTIIGVISFSLISSCVYIVNDIQDVEKDRLHPKKRYRPIASGAISVKFATVIFVLCLLLSLALSYGVASFNAVGIVLLYLVLNIAYSKGLKNKALIDVVILTSGFFLRVAYGAVISHVEISAWLYLTVISGAFYLGFGKRRNEMQQQGSDGTTRKVLKSYSLSFLDKNMYVCLALTNMFYALWATSKESQAYFISVPLVMIIFMQYSLDIEGDSDGDPVEVIGQDKTLICLVLLYAILMVTLLYGLRL
jgi:prenyltransferase, ubiA family